MGGVERGERNLTLQSLERIAATLHIDPTELLQRRGEQSEVKTLVTHLGKKLILPVQPKRKEDVMDPVLEKLLADLALIAARNTASSISTKVSAIRAKKQDAQAINELCEIINDLVSDREQLLGISRGLEEQFTAQHISDDEIRHLIETVIPAIKNFISKIGDESALQAIDQFTPVALYRYAGSSPDSRIQLLCSDRRAAHGTSSLLYPLQNDTQH